MKICGTRAWSTGELEHVEVKPRVLPCLRPCLYAGPAHRSFQGSMDPPTVPSSSQPARSPPTLQSYGCNWLCPNKVSAPGRAHPGHELQVASEQHCCNSCRRDAEVSDWLPLMSSNCLVFQSVPSTTSIIPASLKQQPSAVDMSHVSVQDRLANHVPDHIPAVAA